MNSVNVSMFILGSLIILFLGFWSWFRWRKIIKYDVKPWVRYALWGVFLITVAMMKIMVVVFAVTK